MFFMFWFDNFFHFYGVKLSMFSRMFTLLVAFILVSFSLFGSERLEASNSIVVELSLPSFEMNKRSPYIALWLSDKNNKFRVLNVKRGDVKWLNSLKKFWRDVARENRSESDAVTSATSREMYFRYEFKIKKTWDYIFIEVARESGKKELIRMPVSREKNCIFGHFEIEKACVQIILLKE